MVKPAFPEPWGKSAVAVLFAAPVALLSACAPPGEVPADAPGTTPSVWTGSPAPGSGAESHGEESSGSEALVVPLRNVGGAEVATATFDFESGFVKVTVETTGTAALTPGFHGLHIHAVGKCEPSSTAPAGGAPGAFLSAGGHFQAPGHSGHPMSGDLSSLQVREDGSALLVTTTDAFTEDDLKAGSGTAIMIHEGADNFANIPDRYSADGVAGPDANTMATGDAGSRVACGVISAG
ncbi:superoxide dismutase[Cu-Zn] [Mycolicibacterium brumae]|uniref:Superoxide dismutase [Cu-Zn] n=1 Tax=Mycolicibacterium brumae TaxID=85968 RepID=A0A2G5PHE5_9MYCO|nr:superoxide dismutase family protein [Mycolicibacterium brumae]MCV7192565.1 superoxide dismutase family protein [Mycolicibacterium brumae]PIB77443.1 superoxide dismutase [Mycolicibacterium brumae]UWW10335.1 superoxide dismutase family protein [Mycolicibacterium brumae]